MTAEQIERAILEAFQTALPQHFDWVGLRNGR